MTNVEILSLPISAVSDTEADDLAAVRSLLHPNVSADGLMLSGSSPDAVMAIIESPQRRRCSSPTGVISAGKIVRVTCTNKHVAAIWDSQPLLPTVS
jgi:hypothetical protein